MKLNEQMNIPDTNILIWFSKTFLIFVETVMHFKTTVLIH